MPCTGTNTTTPASKNQRNRDSVGLRNGTSRPTRKNAEIQFPPTFGSSLRSISRVPAISLFP